MSNVKPGRRWRTRESVAQSPSDVPTVTVVIPSFNYARFLRGAVESVLRQVDVAVDVVVVDDCSTDNTVEVAGELARDPRVTVLRNDENLGPVETFNRGLEQVTGEFVVRLDADDELTPGSLARSTALARQFPSVGLVYGNPVHFHGSRPDRARMTVTSWTVWSGLAWLRDRCSDGHNVITSPEVLMRSSVVAAVGGQRPLAHTHDMEMWFRISAVSDIGHIEGADQAWHRDHGQSLSAAVAGHVGVTLLEEKRAAFDELFSFSGFDRSQAERLHELARRSLASEALHRAGHQFDRGRIDRDEARQLVDFARDTFAQAETLRSYGRVARRIEEGRPPMATVLTAPALLAHRIRTDVEQRRWRRWGVYHDSVRSRGGAAGT